MPDGSTFSQDPTTLRLTLLANGWVPVPITSPDYKHPGVRSPGKQPFLKGWDAFTVETLTTEIVKGWRGVANQPGTGLVCGKLVVVDIDMPVEDLAARLRDLTTRMVGSTPFVRIGRAPKVALLYRVAEPMTKLQTPTMITASGVSVKVEILAEGQQVVAYGVHPDTGQLYRWLEAAPHTHPFTDVPEVTADVLEAFVLAAEATLRQAGAQPTTAKARHTSADPKPSKRTDEPRKLNIRKAYPPPSREIVAEALAAVPNRHDWEGWVRIGAALFDALADDGEELFIRWSAQSPKDDPETTRAKWRSYRTSPMDVTIGTLFWEAAQNGWLRPWTDPPVDHTPNAAEPNTADDFELTEDGVALAFERENQDALRYCHDTGAWFVFTGTHWSLNWDGLAFTRARSLVRKLNRTTDFRTRAITGKAAFVASVEKYAQRARGIAVTAATWDQDPFLLGTPGGVVDLRTGQLRPPRLDHYITKRTAVSPAAAPACPTWLRFLQEATAGDEDLVRFLQQWCGYSLTGSTREHALLFVYGPGGNGKSVLLNTVARILGDYHQTAAMNTFTEAGTGQHLTFLAMMRGARMVAASETEEGRPWAESRIKQMTGGDPITANFMRRDPFTFLPQFKLLIVGNHKPMLRNVDEAARRRFNIVPFVHKPATPDRRLEEKLWHEASGILRWMIEGCLDWQQHGLLRPAVVVNATAEYFEAQDVIGRWIAERCIRDATLTDKPGRLLADCRAWAIENGETPPTPSAFRSAIEKIEGVRYSTVKGTQFVRGVGLKTPLATGREECPGVEGVEEGGGVFGSADIRARAAD
ncbi:phage/plasmid primase, P4 family [Falsiroseomonas sp. HW251]|uniref:phage/plasmid primase, P4 family n=1 Tax=Falsiroseomonas sp. HW251 TaxID=3390998 RepID=UPI003D31E807